MAETFTVVDVRRMPSPNPQRMGKYDQMVVYELGPGQRFVLSLPAEGFTEETLRAAVKADLAERGKWLNREIKLEG